MLISSVLQPKTAAIKKPLNINTFFSSLKWELVQSPFSLQKSVEKYCLFEVQFSLNGSLLNLKVLYFCVISFEIYSKGKFTVYSEEK